MPGNTEYPLSLDVAFSDKTESITSSWRASARSVASGGEIDKALQRAVNRALDSAKTKAWKLARDGYTVNVERIKGSTFLRRSRNGGDGDLSAELRFTGSRIPAVDFTHAPAATDPKDPQPTYVQFRKDGGGTVEGAFTGRINARQKAPAMYMRKHRGAGSAALGLPGTHGRFPVTKVTGPAVVSMVGHEREAADIQERAREILDKRIDHEMMRLLTK